MALPVKSIKRFIYVLVIGSLAFCTFYWYSLFSSKHRRNGIFMDGVPDYWRWECNPYLSTCERRIWKDGDFGQSLRSCQMTCGPIPLWPQPNGEVHLSKRSLSFRHADINILQINAHNIDVRFALLNVYRELLKDIRSDSSSNPTGIQRTDLDGVYVSTHVFGNGSYVDFKLGADESYKLTIHNSDRIVHVSIKSATFIGAKHAVETLRQLIWYDEVSSCFRIISTASIVDSPSFSYRGLLLDTANHYIPISAIKRTVNAMAMVKLNIFHWHITGPTSFPFAFRNMQHAMYGAYSSKKVYTTTDIADVIKYATQRGVKVLLEVDNPGGVGKGWSWGHRQGAGDLNLCFKNETESCKNNSYCSQINPNNKNSYKYLREIFQVIQNITKHPDISHLGGSIDIECWIGAPEIAVMDVYNRKGILGVLKYHQTMVYNMIKDIYKTEVPNIILWSDFFKQYNDPTEMMDSRIYIAQINGESVHEDEKVLTNKGYRVIISHADKWDLSRSPLWETAYDHRPWEQLLWSQREQVLGGEALLWTNVTDEYSLDNRLWPIAAAVAEVLWTDPQIANFSTATLRMQLLRDRLVERQIAAASIAPKWCTQNPGACLNRVDL